MGDFAVKTGIRKAVPDDATALAQLLRSLDLFPRISAEPEEATESRVGRHLRSCIESSSHSVYVATDEGDRLLGYVAVHWLPYLILTGPEGFISELFVADNARGGGIGTALLAVVEAEAAERGCPRLQLINFRSRESYVRKFYEKNGWTERPDGASFLRRIELERSTDRG